jgi:hypothetical protein
MKDRILSLSVFLLLIGTACANEAFSASASPVLLKAKSEAEAKGYVFYTAHDEIVANAKKEAQLRVVTSLDPTVIKVSTTAFMKKYPFVDLYCQYRTGPESVQRFLLELKSGKATEWDVLAVPSDFRSEHLPYLSKIDILGMAEQGLLQIPLPMIEPVNRNSVAFRTPFHVTAYNKNLVPTSQIPNTWEALLRPEFKGRKFAVDVRPYGIAALVPSWGLEKTLDFARKIAQQQPIWVRGVTRTLTNVLAGEVPMLIGATFHNVKGVQAKDRAGVLQYSIPEPVPLRIYEEQGILFTSRHLNAALLWFEWMASPEAQQLADEQEPMTSVYVRGGAVEKELRGKKLSVVSWEHQQHMDEWQGKIFEAFGFPKAEGNK